MRFQLSLTLLLTMNHSEAALKVRRSVNIKTTILRKVQHAHCTMTKRRLLLQKSLHLLINLSAVERVIHNENLTEKAGVISQKTIT